MILADASKCIGCSACSNVCPSKIITRETSADKVIISFAQCREECDLCVEFCPSKALTLVEEAPATVVTLDLVPCRKCGQGYATRPMLERLEATIPTHLQMDAAGMAWLDICPSCRRGVQRERAVRETVMRSRGVTKGKS